MDKKIIFCRISTGQMSHCQLIETFLTPADYREISEVDKEYILSEYGNKNVIHYMTKDSTPEKPVFITEERFHFIVVEESELTKPNPVHNGFPVIRVIKKAKTDTSPINAKDVEIIKEPALPDNSISVLASMPDETGAVKDKNDAEVEPVTGDFKQVAESGTGSDTGKRSRRNRG